MEINEAFKSALGYQGSGDLQKAEHICKDILEAQPTNLNARNLLGVLCLQQKNYLLAIQHFEKAVSLGPNNPIVYFNLGNALRSKGNYGDAITSYQKAVQLDPNMADAYTNLGLVYQQRGDLQTAIACYQKAIQLDPNMTDAYNNLGLIYQQKGDFQTAITCYQKAIQLSPDMAEAYNNLGLLFFEEGRIDEAVVCYHNALQINTEYADAYYNLGMVLYVRGNREEAMFAYDMAIRYNPEMVAARFGCCISQLLMLYPDESSILISRQKYRDELIKLRDNLSLNSKEHVDLAVDAVGRQQPFQLAYQGFNDVELQRMYGELVCRIMHAKNPQFAERPVMHPSFAGETLRVGVVSGYFYRHSNWKIPIKGWVENLDRQRFDLFGYYTGKIKDEATLSARGCFRKFVEDIHSFEELCQMIQDDKLHILIFPEIGMDPTTIRLAALRLAPVQCTSWGHPETSGLPTIDYFLSSDLMEPPDADEHYTEKLIRLPNLSISYAPLDIPAIEADRNIFGLRPGSTLFLCCQSLFKYLPQYDEIYARIAQQVSDCQFIFIAHKSSWITEQYRLRLCNEFETNGLNPEEYLVFLPRLSQEQFHALNRVADVYLDSIEWSGCNTTLEALACNLPVVTLPGKLMRGRHSAAILKMMGLHETIAESLDHYIAIAVKLGKDVHYRKQITEMIASGRHRIYCDKTCIVALEEFFEKVVRERK
jgi:protein O-GlcNAc transferase